ncbi:MAG: hypothetical protein JXQ68_02770 [Campylobacterales bacterium]|nr:hypothetical protein [Campylobacterales bacterium]
MNILLINKNPVVSKMIELACDEYEANLNEQCEFNPDDDSLDYHYILIDDTTRPIEETLEILPKMKEKAKVVLITSQKRYEKLKERPEIFDDVLIKPFLPSHAIDIFQKIQEIQKEDMALRIEDINEIKELLKDEGIEKKDKKKFSKQSQEAVDNIFATHQDNLEQKILKAIKDMKPKKLKKLLKDANIKLSIDFAEDQE